MVPKAMLDVVLEQLSMLRNQIARMQETIDKLVEDIFNATVAQW